MYNEKFTGMVTKFAAGVKVVKGRDGEKLKAKIYKVTIESADIDYEIMQKFSPAVSSTILNIQPAPFRAVDFGSMEELNVGLRVYPCENEDGEMLPITDPIDTHKNVLIANLTVKVTQNIPTYIFSIELPQVASGGVLSSILKTKVQFEFFKY